MIKLTLIASQLVYIECRYGLLYQIILVKWRGHLGYRVRTHTQTNNQQIWKIYIRYQLAVNDSVKDG